MNIITNPIETITQNQICDICGKEFGSKLSLDRHTIETHSKEKIIGNDVNDELQEITFDIIEDKSTKHRNLPNKDIFDEGKDSAITVQPSTLIIPPVSSNNTFCCCIIDNSSKENDYQQQQYSYAPEHNSEGCCDCDGVDCDNCCSDFGNCEDCNWDACCTECGSCITDCNCNCEECVII